MDRVYSRVAALPRDAAAKRALDKVGLCAYTITWEDTARTKGSSYGNNISDMTLNANNRDLPIIRRPNFSDLTWDSPHERIQLTVGNEHGEGTRQVSLKEYLTHIADHLHEPLLYKGKSLFDAERDVNVLMAAQACMLPVPKGDGADKKTKFCVTLRNYQGAVATIVSTNDGTSFHVIDNSGKERLYYNKDGQRCQLLAERLGAFRRAQGRPDDGSPMNAEEKAKNMILIIQVPLKPKPSSRGGAGGFSFGSGAAASQGFSFGGGGGGGFGVSKGSNKIMAAASWGAPAAAPVSAFWDDSAPTQPIKGININEMAQYDSPVWEQEMECASNVALPDGDDDDDDIGDAGAEAAHVPTNDEDSMDVADDVEAIEHAIVSVGEPEGTYDELAGQGGSMERDLRYPIRVTLQYYRATTSGTMNERIAREIDQQFRDARTYYGAVAAGSLVLTAASGRTTEMQHAPLRPAWWPTFLEWHWPQFKDKYASPAAAGEIVFKNGRFVNRGMRECEQSILQVLKANETVTIATVSNGQANVVTCWKGGFGFKE